MATRARRFCTTPRCPTLTNGGACPTCRRQRDRARGGATARGYDATWARYSRQWLAIHPTCGERADGSRSAEDSRCVQEGRCTPAAVTDHRRALRAGGAKYDPRNHQSLCAACHRRKTIRCEGALAPAV